MGKKRRRNIDKFVLPMETIDTPYIFEESSKIAKKYPNEVGGGKWMLFVHRYHLNTMWIRACTAYREGKLTGVHSIKSSTAFRDEEKCLPKENVGVISFHCGPSYNKPLMLSYAQAIMMAMNSLKFFGLKGYMSYKSDEMTQRGVYRKSHGSGNCNLYIYEFPMAMEVGSYLENSLK